MSNDKKDEKGLDRLFGDMPPVPAEGTDSPPESQESRQASRQKKKASFVTKSIRVDEIVYEKMQYIADARGMLLKDVYDTACKRFIGEWEKRAGEIIIRKKRKNKDLDDLFEVND